jgi:cell wall-associated NlpC family hydrolase
VAIVIRSSKVFHRRARVLGCGLAATVITSIMVGSVAPVSASADPVADKKAQAAALAAKINADGHQVEILAEQFNTAQLHATQVARQLADAQQHLASAQATATQERLALHDEAVVAYLHGGVTKAQGPTAASGGADLAVAAGYFRLATASQANALDRFHQAELDLRQQQAALEAAQRDSQAAVANTASRQQAVSQAAAASQATLNQVQGDLVQLVAQQQAAIAAQQQTLAMTQLAAVVPKLTANVPSVAANAALSTPLVGASVSGQVSNGVISGQLSVTTPPPTSVSTTTKPPVNNAPPPPPASSGAGAAVAYARAQLGKPYLWAGAGPASFDCSGLTMRAWGAAGVSLPHSAASQYANTAHVPIADLQPGDLVFFGSGISHVGIYVGGGQMIHAPHSGTVVGYSTIFWPDLLPMGGRP